MTAVGDDRDDLVQQLAEAMRADVNGGYWSGWKQTARAVLKSGLVTPVQPLRELVDQFERTNMLPGEFVTKLLEKLP